MTKKFYQIILLIYSCWACNTQQTSYENYQTLTGEYWDRDSIIAFHINITETGNYLLNICIRHTTDYQHQDIVCLTHTAFNSAILSQDTTHLFLTTPNGNWLGQGSNSLKTTIQQTGKVYTFDTIGEYTFLVRHWMQEKKLNGIKNIGIKITKK